ncbi:Hypothetical_protein [Hexamita inflata]|uniref:Hypothetical_protein n=1 Tax=Hexamita inflata TaxID=28002 RepID=A0AA86QZN9_9EUKA|nr:Hypothetical protein HINF_LOCUS50364 [Hexamita inflata]
MNSLNLPGPSCINDTVKNPFDNSSFVVEETPNMSRNFSRSFVLPNNSNCSHIKVKNPFNDYQTINYEEIEELSEIIQHENSSSFDISQSGLSYMIEDDESEFKKRYQAAIDIVNMIDQM